MDLKIRELARQAGLGNLNAAKQLVRYLERAGADNDEEKLINLAREFINIYNRTFNSEDQDLDLDDLYNTSNTGEVLAEEVLNYFGQPTRSRGPEIMECCGRFENEGHHPECPQHEIDMGYEELEDD